MLKSVYITKIKLYAQVSAPMWTFTIK